jgi:hypothetical protein
VVILVLTTMLILSAALSINAVWPVLGAVGLFGLLHAIYLTACVLPGYARARAVTSPRRPAPPIRTAAPPAVLDSRLPAAR